jgi:hypothetical protein
MIMDYTHDGHCDMLLNPGNCNSRAATDAREYALHLPGQSQYRHRGTKALEKLTRYRTRIEPIPTEGPQSASCRSIASIPLLAERTCFQMIGLHGCNFVNGCNMNTLRMSSFCKIFFYFLHHYMFRLV